MSYFYPDQVDCEYYLTNECPIPDGAPENDDCPCKMMEVITNLRNCIEHCRDKIAFAAPELYLSEVIPYCRDFMEDVTKQYPDGRKRKD